MFDEWPARDHSSHLFAMLARVLARAETKALDLGELQANSLVLAQTVTCASFSRRRRDCRYCIGCSELTVSTRGVVVLT